MTDQTTTQTTDVQDVRDRMAEAHRVTIGQLRGAEARIRLLEAEVAVDYADRLVEAMDRAKDGAA